MKLIVGLGNVGEEYKNTRHNIGFYILDNYTKSIIWKKNDYGYFYKEKDIIYLKPTTYMNLSGIAINYFCNYYKLDVDDVLIIYDDIYTEIGSFKIKYDSSSGGHNGIKSITSSLKTQKFLKIKVGVSNNSLYEKKNYVLGKISSKEIELINNILPNINSVIDEFIKGKDKEYLMNKYNKKNEKYNG